MAIPTLSFSESQAFTALGSFLLGISTPLDPTQPMRVIRGQAGNNQVPEPSGPDFIVMTPLRQKRLATNDTTYQDNVLTGSISDTTLIVTEIAQAQSPLGAGMLIIDGNWPQVIAANTTIIEQLTGPEGSVGTYRVSVSQNLPSQALYVGVRSDLVPTEWTVQLDIHGPNSGNNTKIIEGLFRSDYGTFAIGEPSDWQLVPLYCDEAREVPFINDQQQYEYRWSMDAVMQINPIIGTPAQFFDQVELQTIEAYPRYVEGDERAAPPIDPPTNPGGLVPRP